MQKLVGIKIWFFERFPPMNFISGFFMYLLPKSLAILFSKAHPESTSLDWQGLDALLMLIPAMHLLILRCFDEHKDYLTDKVFNPHRSLQRGLISLQQIRVIGFLAFFVQLGIFLLARPNQELDLIYLGTWVWTLLMWKEFFVKDWLKAHYLVYALLHMVITPSILILCLRLAQAPKDFDLDLILLGFLTSFIYEVSRKTKAPDEESGDVSYSKLWGVRLSCLMIFLLGLLTLWVGGHLLQQAAILNGPVLGIFGVLLILHMASLGKFLRQPSAKARKSNEGTSALIGLVIFLAPIISLLIEKIQIRLG